MTHVTYTASLLKLSNCCYYILKPQTGIKTLLGLLEPEDRENPEFRNIRNYFPKLHSVKLRKSEVFSNNSAKFRVKILAPELFILILAHPVYKMWIIQEPNTLEL